MKRQILGILFGTLASVAYAQVSSTSSEQGGLPSGPLVKQSIPEGTRWTITKKSSKTVGTQGSQGLSQPQQNSGSDQKDTAKEMGNAAGNGMQIIGEKKGGIAHVVTIYSNGNRSEVWKKGDRQVEMNAGWKEPVISVVPSESFEDVSWISASNFSGLYKVHGQQCMVFRDHILPLVYRENPNLLKQPELPDGSHMNEADRKELEEYRKYLQQIAVDPETLKIDVLAYVDLQSRLPIALKMGDEVVSFQYESLPDGYTLSLPVNVTTAIEAQKLRAQAVEYHPARP